MAAYCNSWIQWPTVILTRPNFHTADRAQSTALTDRIVLRFRVMAVVTNIGHNDKMSSFSLYQAWRHSENMCVAVLVAAQTALVGHSLSPAYEATLMIPAFFPVFLVCSSKSGMTFLVMCMVAMQFTLISLSWFLYSMFSKKPTQQTPAQLMSRLMSKSLICSQIDSYMVGWTAVFPKSACTIIVLTSGYTCLMTFSTLSSLLTVLLTRQMLKPSLAYYVQNTAPMPSDAPVMTTHDFSPYSVGRLRGNRTEKTRRMKPLRNWRVRYMPQTMHIQQLMLRQLIFDIFGANILITDRGMGVCFYQMETYGQDYKLTVEGYNIFQMSTMMYGGGYIDMFSPLLEVLMMPVDMWLERHNGTIRFLLETQQEAQMVHCMFQLVAERQGDRNVINYFRLVDKLMRTRKSFAPFLENILIDMYTMVFVSFWQRGLNSSLEELKILRKIWLGTVSLAVLQAIRQRVMETVGIDVEVGFTRQTIDQIQHYYRSVLKMDDWQIRQHLPAMTQKELEIRFMQPQPYVPHEQMRFLPEPMPHHQMVYTAQAAGPPVQRQQLESKRQRDYLVEEEPGKSRKKRHLDEKSIKGSSQPIGKSIARRPEEQKSNVSQPSTESKLMFLRGMGRFTCQKCGVCFGEERAYDSHLRFHFQQNLQKYDMKVRRVNVIYRASNLSAESWINTNEENVEQQQLDNYYIPSSQFDQTGKKPNCRFCGQKFRVKLIEKIGCWAYVNCIEATHEDDGQNDTKIALHKNCFEVLKPSKQ